MDDAEQSASLVLGLVRIRESVGDLDGDHERHVERHRLRACLRLTDERPDVPPIDELENLERDAVRHRVVEHRDDRRVMQLARDARLVEEHPDHPGVARRVAKQPLDGDAPDEAVRAVRGGLVHLGHSARAQPPTKLVAFG